MKRYLWLALGLFLILAGCSGSVSPPLVKEQPVPAPGQVRVIKVQPTIIGAKDEAQLIVRVRVPGPSQGLKTQALPATFAFALAVLSGPALDAPRSLSIPFTSFSPVPSPTAGPASPPPVATGVFQNLRPGDGYSLVVTLHSNAATVVASGETPVAFPLVAGTNLITVTLSLSSDITLPLPLPLTFSGLFNNSTVLGTSTVVVLGDQLRILPGVTDPSGQLGKVELWLDGAGTGQLLATWYPDGFGTSFDWDTGTTILPAVIGTEPVPAPTPPATPNPFVSPTPPPTPPPSSAPVPPPSAVDTETAGANHTLSFTLHDRLAPADNDLIETVTYDLTVVNPAAIDVGIE